MGGSITQLLALLTHSLTHSLMAVALLLSLACAGALLSSVRTQVPPGHRSGVDLALEQLASHAGVHLHFRFLRSLDKSEMEVKTHSLLYFCSRFSQNCGETSYIRCRRVSETLWYAGSAFRASRPTLVFTSAWALTPRPPHLPFIRLLFYAAVTFVDTHTALI